MLMYLLLLENIIICQHGEKNILNSKIQTKFMRNIKAIFKYIKSYVEKMHRKRTSIILGTNERKKVLAVSLPCQALRFPFQE